MGISWFSCFDAASLPAQIIIVSHVGTTGAMSDVIIVKVLFGWE